MRKPFDNTTYSPAEAARVTERRHSTSFVSTLKYRMTHFGAPVWKVLIGDSQFAGHDGAGAGEHAAPGQERDESQQTRENDELGCVGSAGVG